MKVSLDWLKEFINVEDIPLSSLAELMTIRGLEVDHFDLEVLEVSQTPDLGYTRSVLGVARFLKQLLDRSVKLPQFSPIDSKAIPDLQVTIEKSAIEHVDQYYVRSLKNIQNNPSPEWMQKRLKASGITPKNLIVDVTNYVQIALGQPMHAFDRKKLGDNLSIGLSDIIDDFEALNDQTLKVPKNALVISSSSKPVAIAGIIGSKDSAVSDTSEEILLESAQFCSRIVRKTSKAIKLFTPSSQRFENQIDPGMTKFALDYATSLLIKYGDAKVDGTSQIVHKQELTKKAKLDHKQVESILGIETTIDELVQVMQRIDASILDQTEESIEVAIPAYRTDLFTSIDLVEEVIKILGFERLVEKEAMIPLSAITSDEKIDFKRYVREKLLEQGLTEIMTPSLIDKEHLIDPTSSIEVKNALSDRSILRTSLIYGAIESVLYNQNHGNFELKGFEIGNVYFKQTKGFSEQGSISIVLEKEGQTFFDLKGHLKTLLDQLHIDNFITLPSHLEHFHPFRQATVEVHGIVLGHLGELHPLLLKRFGIKKRVYFAEINLLTLMQNTKKTFHIRPISSYPSIERDITLSIKKSISWGFITSIIETNRPKLLENFDLKSIYDPNIENATHNVTLHFVFRSFEGSLTQQQVDESMQTLLSKLESEINS